MGSKDDYDNDDDVDHGEGDDEEEEAGEPLPESVIKRLDLLKELEETRRKKFDEYLAERAALEAKYNTLYAKIYDERSQIVQGTQEVVAVDPKEDDDDDVKGVPQFWVCALGNHEEVAAMLNEKDVDCLAKYLRNISCDDDEDGKGFTLKFTFSSENPYFSNEVLTKRYEVPNLLTGDEPILKKVEGTEILWKEEQNLTQNVVIKKQRGKGKHSGQIRTVKKTEPIDSFFGWFLPPKMPSLLEDMDEETVANLEVAAVMDYEIATALRTQIVPRAILWFTGEAAIAGEASDDLEAAVDEAIAAVNE